MLVNDINRVIVLFRGQSAPNGCVRDDRVGAMLVV